MAPPIDTGSMQVGRERDTSLSATAVDERVVAALREENAELRKQLLWYQQAYFLAVESRNHCERMLSELQQNRSCLAMPAVAASVGAVALPPVVSESRKLTLPFPFVDVIRDSARLTDLLVQIIRRTIVPEVNGRGSKTVLWSHVKRVMEEYVIIPAATKNKEFAGAMAIIDSNVNAESVRHSCEGCMLPKGNHRTWKQDSRDRALCYEVERWLQPLLSELGR